MATTAEIIDALRQQFAQVQMGSPNLDMNGNDTGIRYLRQPDGSTLTLQRNANGGWQGLLGDPFDQPGEQGQYGGYLGTFDDGGKLTDARWKQLQRSDGWFGENLSTIGPALVLGAAGVGGGLFGGGTAAGTTGAELTAMEAAGMAPAAAPITQSAVSALGPAATFGDMAPAGSLGSFLTPGNIGAAASLAGGLAGAGSIPTPQNNQPDPSIALNANVDRINSLFGNRQGIYDKVRDDAYSLQSSRLGENRDNTLRSLKFGLARSGLTAGSADIDAKAGEQRAFGRALTDASNAAQGQADQVRANDERTRLNLISQMRTGLDANNATQSAYSQMASNVADAQNQQRFNSIDNYMSATAPIVGQFQTRQAQQQARNDYPAYRTAGSYNGTISR